MAHHKLKSEDCLNCGYTFTDADNYCPQCGQENHSLNVPLKHFFLELLEGTIHFDTKSIKTFLALLFKPGHLTIQYNEGKRVRYVPPLRLYIFISFLFFIVINILPGKSDHGENKSTLNYEISSIGSKDLEGLDESKIDSLLIARRVDPDGFEEYLVRQLWKVANGGKNEFSHFWIKNISYMLFVLMPFFGWLVYNFHRKRKRYYFEYLIFSVHFHCFLFLELLVFFLVISIWFNIFILILFLIWALIYLYKSLRRCFYQNRLSVILKSFLLSMLYVVSLVMFFLVTIAISIALF
jgi:hypothetical protein